VPTKDSIEMEKPESLTQMENVLEVLNEGVIVASDEHRIVFANSRFVEMTRFPRHELIGVDASSFYSSEEWGFLTQQLTSRSVPATTGIASFFPKEAVGVCPSSSVPGRFAILPVALGL
jgi:PAS domain-containing protein